MTSDLFLSARRLEDGEACHHLLLLLLLLYSYCVDSAPLYVPVNVNKEEIAIQSGDAA